MDCLDWIDLSIGVRQKGHVKSFLMNAHAKNPILSQINILVVKHGLIAFRVNIDAATIDKIRQGSPQNSIRNTHLTFHYFLIGKFFINRLEIALKKLIILFLVVLKDSLHVVG